MSHAWLRWVFSIFFVDWSFFRKDFGSMRYTIMQSTKYDILNDINRYLIQTARVNQIEEKVLILKIHEWNSIELVTGIGSVWMVTVSSNLINQPSVLYWRWIQLALTGPKKLSSFITSWFSKSKKRPWQQIPIVNWYLNKNKVPKSWANQVLHHLGKFPSRWENGR